MSAKHIYTAVLISGLLAFLNNNAQTPQELFAPKKPSITDTIYYPFYNDVQMIKVDHLARYDKEIFYLEQSAPRAIPYSSLLGPPQLNEYIFRNKSGKIIKAFNTRLALDSLTYYFRNKPINQKNKNPLFTYPYHGGNKRESEGVWVYSPQSAYWFDGYYKVQFVTAANSKQQPRKLPSPDFGFFGLIDSLGTIKVPIEYANIYPVGKNLLVQTKNGWGIIDKQLNVLLPPEYDSYKYESEDIITFLENEKLVKLYKINEEKSFPLNNYDEVYQLGDVEKNNITAFVKNNKIGFIDKHFKEIVPAIYDHADHYYPAIAETPVLVSRNDRWGYLDRNAREFIPCTYMYAEPFSAKGTALVQEDNKWHCIDTKGKTTGPCDAKPKWETNDDNEEVQIVHSTVAAGKYGLVKNGIVILPLTYRAIYRKYNEDLFRLERFEKWGLSDKEGQLLLPCEYQRIDDFYEGQAIVKKDDKFGIINSDATIIVPVKYEDMSFVKPGVFIERLNGKDGVMDTLGQVIVPNKYDRISGFGQLQYIEHANEFSQVELDKRFGFIDLSGNEIIPVKYEWLDREVFSHLVAFRDHKKYGFLNTKGEIVIPAIYNSVGRFEKPVCGVSNGKRCGLIDTAGKQVTPFIYDQVITSWQDRKYMVVLINGKQGVVNAKAELIIPCKYDYINYDYHGRFHAKLGKKDIVLNEKGEESR